MNIPILTNAMAGLTDDYNSNRNNDNVRNYHESRGSRYSYHSSDSSSGVVRQAVDTSIIVGDSGYAKFGM